MMTFVFTNPRHHLDMMVPVARALADRGAACRFVSLAELRGFETPDLSQRLPRVEVRRAIPRIRRNPAVGAGIGTDHYGAAARVRQLAQRAVWTLALSPRLSSLLDGSRVVAVPNDAAFPYEELAGKLRDREIPFALLQEGIRFPLPAEQAKGAIYGLGGASALCAWGEASAAHFRSVGVPLTAIRVTGNPRFDGVDPTAWRDRGRELAASLGLDREPLLYLSNTIDDQGFCTTAQKMELFASFLRESAPLVQREGRAIAVKLHAREDVQAFRAVAKAFPHVHVLDDAPLFAVLAMGCAAVVLASTVGLEALAFGLPLGVLEIPGHGHVFDYVASGAAVALTIGNLEDGVGRLLAGDTDRSRAAAFLDSHMAHRGNAARRIAETLHELSEGRLS